MIKPVTPRPCAPRRRFATREAAQAAAARIAVYQGHLRRPETCSRCNGWHLAAPEHTLKRTAR